MDTLALADAENRPTEHLVTEMRKMLQIENSTLFEMGEMLDKAGLSKGGLETLATEVGRGVDTLQKRLDVAREFPASRRIPGLAFTAYTYILQLDDKEHRQDVLDAIQVTLDRGECLWTVEKVHRAVREFKKAEYARRDEVVGSVEGGGSVEELDSVDHPDVVERIIAAAETTKKKRKRRAPVEKQGMGFSGPHVTGEWESEQETLRLVTDAYEEGQMLVPDTRVIFNDRKVEVLIAFRRT